MRKIACFRMPKVASLSLAFALKDRCEMLDHADEKVDGEIMRRFRSENLDAFVFAFVRNPFDRLVSAYSWISQRPDSNRAAEEWKRHVEPYGSFGDFVAGEIGEGKGMGLLHLRTQYSWIAGNGRLMVDWVGRYERLEDDLGELCRMMGWPAAMLGKNNGSVRKGYGGYYTPETAAMVVKAYERDFELGGYGKTI